MKGINTKIKKRWILACVILGTAIFYLAINFSNSNAATHAPSKQCSSWLMNDNSRRQCLLRLTPIGMKMDEVKTVIERKNWKIFRFSKENGFGIGVAKDYKIVGAKSIGAEPYENRWYPPYAFYYWGFDQNENLIDIGVIIGWE
jgi:hypothetical protein